MKKQHGGNIGKLFDAIERVKGMLAEDIGAIEAKNFVLKMARSIGAYSWTQACGTFVVRVRQLGEGVPGIGWFGAGV